MRLRQSCAFTALALLTSLVSAQAATRLVRAGENLQTVLNAALPGDVLLLEAGATFSGNFILPVKSGNEFIVLRSSAPDSDLPGISDRATPAMAPRFARIVSPNSMPAISAAPGSHHWKLQFLEVGPNYKGYGDVVEIGDGGSGQYDLSQVPYAFVLDRVYIHGHPALGQKRGIALNGRDVTIRNSYISDIKAIGQDTQAIGGWNGPGPYVIENNYLEAAGENVMFGGATPYIPGVIADGVTVRGNLISRPPEWQLPILPAPGGVHASAQVDGGTLPSGTYAYRVVARRPAGQTNIARSDASLEVLAVVPAGTLRGMVTVSWDVVPEATEYWVYGRQSGAQTMYWKVTQPGFVDTGAAGVSGTVPTSAGTRWTVKNLFELKAARNVTVSHNILENNWDGGQPGYAIVFTPRGQGGACPWCVVENVTFESNVVRHTGAAINILGYDNGSPTLQTRNIVIRNNLFYDINKARWGGNGWFLQLGDEPRDIIVDHNTVAHDGSVLVYAYGGSSTAIRPVYGFQFTNNAAKHNSYGIWSQYFTFGTQALANYYPNAVVQRNLLAGGPSGSYPAGNFFYTDFLGQFVSPASNDYTLASTSPLRNAGTDGADVGVDMRALCVYSVSKASGSVPSTASTGSLSVTAGTACSWTATSNVSWITITEGASGTGNGTVTYAVAANTGGLRTGTLTIAGESVIITQAGALRAPAAPQSLRLSR
jgi:hypothetical protein